jgi:hypothetical protein
MRAGHHRPTPRDRIRVRRAGGRCDPQPPVRREHGDSPRRRPAGSRSWRQGGRDGPRRRGPTCPGDRPGRAAGPRCRHLRGRSNTSGVASRRRRRPASNRAPAPARERRRRGRNRVQAERRRAQDDRRALHRAAGARRLGAAGRLGSHQVARIRRLGAGRHRSSRRADEVRRPDPGPDRRPGPYPVGTSRSSPSHRAASVRCRQAAGRHPGGESRVGYGVRRRSRERVRDRWWVAISAPRGLAGRQHVSARHRCECGSHDHREPKRNRRSGEGGHLASRGPTLRASAGARLDAAHASRRGTGRGARSRCPVEVPGRGANHFGRRGAGRGARTRCQPLRQTRRPNEVRARCQPLRQTRCRSRCQPLRQTRCRTRCGRGANHFGSPGWHHDALCGNLRPQPTASGACNATSPDSSDLTPLRVLCLGRRVW